MTFKYIITYTIYPFIIEFVDLHPKVLSSIQVSLKYLQFRRTVEYLQNLRQSQGLNKEG